MRIEYLGCSNTVVWGKLKGRSEYFKKLFGKAKNAHIEEEIIC